MKKLLSAFLAVLMVFGCISTSLVHVFAEDSDWNATSHFTPDTQSSSSQWTQSGTSAQSLAGRTFFMEVRVTNNSGSAQTKEFVLTGNGHFVSCTETGVLPVAAAPEMHLECPHLHIPSHPTFNVL